MWESYLWNVWGEVTHAVVIIYRSIGSFSQTHSSIVDAAVTRADTFRGLSSISSIPVKKSEYLHWIFYEWKWRFIFWYDRQWDFIHYVHINFLYLRFHFASSLPRGECAHGSLNQSTYVAQNVFIYPASPLNDVFQKNVHKNEKKMKKMTKMTCAPTCAIFIEGIFQPLTMKKNSKRKLNQWKTNRKVFDK